MGGYDGHQPVTWCKAECNLDSRCRSFLWHETEGCFLRTQCHDGKGRLTYRYSQTYEFRTFYQKPPQGACTEVTQFYNTTGADEILRPNGDNNTIVRGAEVA